MARFEVVSKYAGEEELLIPKRSTKGSVGYDLVCAKDTLIPSSVKHFIKQSQLTGGVTREVVTLKDLKDYIVSSEISFGQKARPTLVPTGIKVYCEPTEYFAVKSRSSFPMKYMLVVSNGEGVIDSDYADNETNEGEIFVQLMNLSPYDVLIKKGEVIGQGMFIPTIKAENDRCLEEIRTGGFGSTDK